jgi:hypothetical protein
MSLDSITSGLCRAAAATAAGDANAGLKLLVVVAQPPRPQGTLAGHQAHQSLP